MPLLSFRERVKKQLNNRTGLKDVFHGSFYREGRCIIAVAIDLGVTVEILRFLIESRRYGSLHAKYEHRTPLYLAIHNCRTDLVQVLLEKGVHHTVTSGKFHTPPIVLAAQRDDVRILEILLRHDPHQINGTDINGITALRSAAKYGNLETARFLLAHGADPTIGDLKEGRTPLFICKSNEYFPLHFAGRTVPSILLNRKKIAALLEEEDRAYLVYKGFLLEHARVVATWDFPRDLFSILHLPQVVQQRLCRKKKLPGIYYTAQGLRARPQENVTVWNDSTLVQEVLYEVWSLKKPDVFRELMGFLL